MTDIFIRKYLKAGKLRQQKAGLVQVEGLLRQSMLDLTEANKIADVAERATYVFADEIALVKGITNEVKASNPQMELKFKIT